MNYMIQAIELAKKGSGHVSPNPLVGAVLVKNHTVIGRGYHAAYGKAHAEIVALTKAGKNARGATLYVNLEPCCHVGKTPPCTAALVAAGIKAVHCATLDPNPLVRGKGKKILERSGIKVVVGEEESPARRLNEIFFKNITTKQPFVLAKWAMGLDGALKVPPGKSKWISSAASRKQAHRLRQRYDAIMVGVNTVIADNPSLTVRHGITNPSHPLRIILDSAGRTPLTAAVLSKRCPGKTVIATTGAMNKKRVQQYRRVGAEVVVVNQRGTVDLKQLFTLLGKRGVASVLIDGGQTVLQEALKKRLVDKVEVFIAPRIIGETTRVTTALSLAVNLEIDSAEAIGNDLHVTAYPKKI